MARGNFAAAVAVFSDCSLRRCGRCWTTACQYVLYMHIIMQGVAFGLGKAAANLRKHGVGFAHAEQALRDQRAATMEDPDAEDEARFVTLGMDAAGRVLVVVWTPRGELARIISARKASKGEVDGYAR